MSGGFPLWLLRSGVHGLKPAVLAVGLKEQCQWTAQPQVQLTLLLGMSVTMQAAVMRSHTDSS
jgi:hypothetical protein